MSTRLVRFKKLFILRSFEWVVFVISNHEFCCLAEVRRAESAKIRSKYPDRIPVCVKFCHSVMFSSSSSVIQPTFIFFA